MRRRRKTKYTWFPQLGTESEDTAQDTGLLELAIPITPAAGILSDVLIFPILPDNPRETFTNSNEPTLADAIGSEYILKRIVGKIHLRNVPYDSAASNRPQSTIIVGAGFFIARAGGEDATTGPIGSDVDDDRRLNYGPLNLTTVREPWIWRRTWMLSTPVYDNVGTGNLPGSLRWDLSGTAPFNNYTGSVADGPHIDAKTARRVGQDDRLYFALQTTAAPGSTLVGTPESGTQGVLDVRLLGALRKARSRSAF